MKSLSIKVGGMICFLLLITSCVTEEKFLYLNDQIVAANKRIDTLQETTDRKLSGELDSKLVTIRERQAQAEVELTSIKEELRGVSGRLEENNRLVERTIERDTTSQDNMMTRLTILEGRISDLEGRIKRLNAYLGLEAGGAPAGGTSGKGPTVAETPTPPPQAIKTPDQGKEKPEISPEKRLYDLNLALYRDEKYEETIAGFKNFLEKYPASELADNAQYWIGESFMALKQYEQAILAFQTVIKKYPKGNKVPNAILRQALAFYEIKDKTSSRLLLKKLIKQFPQSSEAKIAKGKLKEMK